MLYQNIPSSDRLSQLVKSFWIVDSEGDDTIYKEKIIPDGYPEMIIHYGDHYRINISGAWERQEKLLIAGQITNYFFLENSGKTGMIGIKFQPWAVKILFDLDMDKLVNKVIEFPEGLKMYLKSIIDIAISETSFEEKVKGMESWMSDNFKLEKDNYNKYQSAVSEIIQSKGMLNIHEIIDKVKISERSLERYFKSYTGLSPKRYSRIIRFSSIFNLVQRKSFEWTEVSYLAGFYDQSHFIKNFKEFTGEEPTAYGFDDKNMANLFLRNKAH